METQGKGVTKDPLASLTLAELYASQGHADVAKGIYAQLGRRVAGGPPQGADPGRTGGPAPETALLWRLLCLRQAARQIREAGSARWKAGE